MRGILEGGAFVICGNPSPGSKPRPSQQGGGGSLPHMARKEQLQILGLPALKVQTASSRAAEAQCHVGPWIGTGKWIVTSSCAMTALRNDYPLIKLRSF